MRSSLPGVTPWGIVFILSLVMLAVLHVLLTPAQIVSASVPARPQDAPAGVCPPVQNSTRRSIVYGGVTLNGLPAPVGAVVEAFSPREERVGCFVVASAGSYGAMYINGEDTSVSPAVPGMRSGETVNFRVDGVTAAASPALAWQDDWQITTHQVDLSATGATATPTPTATRTPTPTATRTATPTNTPTATPTRGPETISLVAGMNLVGLPVAPADPNLPAILQPINGAYTLVYAYDGCDAADPWKKFDPALPAFANDLATLDVQHGYWLSMTAAATLAITGTRSVSAAIPLCPGWNLIGYPSAAPVPLPGALSSIAGKYDLVYAYDASDTANPWKKFDPNAPSFANDLAEMGSDKGYWLRATQAVTLTIP